MHALFKEPEVDALQRALRIAVRSLLFGRELAQARDLVDVRFGERNHPAKLNFGDCFASAVAKERDLPLACKGGDFALTDLRPGL